MKRRTFIALIGGAQTVPPAWPLVLRAQQKMPTIGFLGTGTAAAFAPWTAAFEQRLRELGWNEGRNIAIEYRWGEGNPEHFAAFAAEFARRKVDVIVSGGSAVSAIKSATSDIPVVFSMATDPVGGGLVASLPRPGGNVTGFSNQQSELAGKRLELLREVLPQMRRLAILFNAGYAEAVLEMRALQSAAQKLEIQVVNLEIRQGQDIAPAFEALKGQADGLYVVSEGLVSSNRTRIITFANVGRLPTIFNIREFAEVGGLMSYGPNFPDLFRRTADYVDKILRGSKPAELPIEQPTKFDLTVNLSTARAFGITIPQSILSRADEVIE